MTHAAIDNHARAAIPGHKLWVRANKQIHQSINLVAENAAGFTYQNRQRLGLGHPRGRRGARVCFARVEPFQRLSELIKIRLALPATRRVQSFWRSPPPTHSPRDWITLRHRAAATSKAATPSRPAGHDHRRCGPGLQRFTHKKQNFFQRIARCLFVDGGAGGGVSCFCAASSIAAILFLNCDTAAASRSIPLQNGTVDVEKRVYCFEHRDAICLFRFPSLDPPKVRLILEPISLRKSAGVAPTSAGVTRGGEPPLKNAEPPLKEPKLAVKGPEPSLRDSEL